MAVEARRGCGYRKVGGTYLMGGQLGSPCCRFPILFPEVCPCCGAGIRLTRTWTWVDPKPWLAAPAVCSGTRCPASLPEGLGERVGLINVGAQFYPTPEDFLAEAREQGISRRVQALPRGLEVGVSWVMIAHPKVRQEEDGKWRGGIIAMFRVSALEHLAKASEVSAMGSRGRASKRVKQLRSLRERGVTIIEVPDDDKDHQGSVYT